MSDSRPYITQKCALRELILKGFNDGDIMLIVDALCEYSSPEFGYAADLNLLYDDIQEVRKIVGKEA